jgi:hypothetical protein
MTETILRQIFDVLIVLVIIGIVSWFVYGSLKETKTAQSFMTNELGLVIDSTSIGNGFHGEYNFTKEHIVESKDNILTTKTKELDYPEKYYSVVGMEEFSIKSDKYEIK